MRKLLFLLFAVLAFFAVSCTPPTNDPPPNPLPIEEPISDPEPEPLPPPPAPPAGSKILRETADYVWYVHEGAVIRMDLSTGATATLSENPRTYTKNSAADRHDFDYQGIGAWGNGTLLHAIGGNLYLTELTGFTARGKRFDVSGGKNAEVGL